MENYESLGTLGEGTYGVVVKARLKETGQIVAIKKFKESDEDEQVRKTALREVRILKQLKHDNIVNLVEVFRRKGKLYLVFEYVEKTILEELEKHPYGLSEMDVKKCCYQLLKAVEYCHDSNIVHRDIKPENILVSKHGLIKLCDFGFARALAGPGAKYTDYVATRWYRSPELLVGDTEYGKPVDVWAIGCNAAELSNGIPLFPGESDIDQLFHIIRCFGKLTSRHVETFRKNPLYVGVELPRPQAIETIDARFANTQQRYLLDVLHRCLHFDPDCRCTCTELLNSAFFKDGGFDHWYEEELRQIVEMDGNPLVFRRKKARRSRAESNSARNSARNSSAGHLTGSGSEMDGRPSQMVDNGQHFSRTSSVGDGLPDEEPSSPSMSSQPLYPQPLAQPQPLPQPQPQLQPQPQQQMRAPKPSIQQVANQWPSQVPSPPYAPVQSQHFSQPYPPPPQPTQPSLPQQQLQYIQQQLQHPQLGPSIQTFLDSARANLTSAESISELYMMIQKRENTPKGTLASGPIVSSQEWCGSQLSSSFGGALAIHPSSTFTTEPGMDAQPLGTPGPAGMAQLPMPKGGPSQVPNPLVAKNHLYLNPFVAGMDLMQDPSKYGLEGEDHLPNLGRLQPQLIPVHTFPHIPNDSTTYLSGGTVKKEFANTTFPTLGPLDANNNLLKYSSKKKTKKRTNDDKPEKYSQQKFTPAPLVLAQKYSSGPSGVTSSSSSFIIQHNNGPGHSLLQTQNNGPPSDTRQEYYPMHGGLSYDYVASSTRDSRSKFP